MIKKGIIYTIIFCILSVIISFILLFVSKSFENDKKVEANSSTIAFPTIISPGNTISPGNNFSAGNLFPDNSYNKNIINLNPDTRLTLFKEDNPDVDVLIASGEPLGIKFFTQGVLVVGITDIPVSGGKSSPAYSAGIRVRDIILKINDIEVNTNEQVLEIISNSNGEKMKVCVKRNNSTFDCTISAVKSSEDSIFKLGMWVRDSTAGIGTITYYNPKNKEFGALGHGITDPDTQLLMPLNNADVFSAKITSIVKGEQGAPGELRGKFIEDTLLGTLYSNTTGGIYGTAKQKINGVLYPVAKKNEVKPGQAYIYCTIDDSGPQKFSISIVKTNKIPDKSNRDMTVKITDERILNLTGGIVQGMSGSPIIQNEKIIGAITHVFVNDPTSGYGIYIENMLSSTQQQKKAA